MQTAACYPGSALTFRLIRGPQSGELKVGEESRVELTVLSVPGCPNAGVLRERLAVALAGHAEVVVVCYDVVDDEFRAAAAGMRGSPTLLIDGVDPFAGSDRPAGLSCRLYRDASGRLDGAPSVQALREVLARRAITESDHARPECSG